MQMMIEPAVPGDFLGGYEDDTNFLGDLVLGREGLGAIFIEELSPGVRTFWEIASLLSTGACVYHGYKRNHGSIGWAIGWGLVGGLFPVISVGIAAAQGFGKAK
jgi:hypothetical protein